VTDAEYLCLLPAVELARRLRTRELSARELLTASLAHVDAVNPAVNVIVTRDDLRARQRANELDERHQSGPSASDHGFGGDLTGDRVGRYPRSRPTVPGLAPKAAGGPRWLV